jgi:hypothetical protein
VLHIEILGHTLRAGWGRDQIEFEILLRNADAKGWILWDTAGSLLRKI